MSIDVKDAPPLKCGCGASFQDAGDFIKHFGKCWGHSGNKKSKPPQSSEELKRLQRWNSGKPRQPDVPAEVMADYPDLEVAR